MNFKKHQVLNELREKFGKPVKTYKQENKLGYQKWLKKFDKLRFEKETNETFGIKVERSLCEIFCVKYPKHIYTRGGPRDKKITKQLKKIFRRKKLYITNHIGTENKESDFIMFHKRSLSVKTNINGSKVCPQNIGQITKKKFDKVFKTEAVDDQDRKEFIFRNISKMLEMYLENTFCCDYMLWFYKEKNKFLHKILRKRDISRFIFDPNLITWTRTPEKWNESSTVKYKGISIGEFQIHNNRNCIKFRFNMKNLLMIV